MKQIFIQGGNLFVAALMVLGLCAQCSPAHAAGNAKDVYGNFVLVVGGTMSGTSHDCDFNGLGSNCQDHDTNERTRIYPFVVPGFRSQFACQGVALEMMNYYNKRGYQLDARCWAVSK